MKKFLISTAICSSCMLAALPTVASAQTDEASSGVGIGEIVVTAQKRAENIQDVPIAISAVSGQYLESRGIPLAEAQALLTRAFVADAFAGLADDSREALEAETAAWLEQRA